MRRRLFLLLTVTVGLWTPVGLSQPSHQVLQGTFEGDALPSASFPPWTLTSGSANELIEDGIWVVDSPDNFVRGIDLGAVPNMEGQKNVVELRWSATTEDDLRGGDGFQLYAGTRLLRLQPLIYRGRHVLLTGTRDGMSLSTPGAEVNLSDLADYRVTNLNVYRIEWVTDRTRAFKFALSVNGRYVASLPGEVVRETGRFKIVFELKGGKHSIDYVRWRIGEGGTRVVPTLDEEAQLLLDDRLIDTQRGLTRTVHPPKMHSANPVLTPERPWEYSAALLWGSAIFDEDERIFKMWYQSWGNTKNGYAIRGWQTPISYAVSKDGLHWERPSLGVYSFQYPDPRGPQYPALKADDNNIVYLSPSLEGLDSPTVVKDVKETDPRKRYKMSWWHGTARGTGIFRAHSADGIHWQELPDIVLQAGDRNTLFFNPLRQRWTIITRAEASFYELREFGQADGAQLYYTLRPDETDLKACSDCWIYSFIAFPYGNVLIGLPELYSTATDRWWTELAWSHDGETWERDPLRVRFLDGSHTAGSFDFWRRNPQSGAPIRRGNELWFYFSGRETGKSTGDPRGIVGSIGIGILRLDGFCSRDAGEESGTLTTRPFRFTGDRLIVNANVRPEGSIKAALLDESERPLPGFGIEDARRIEGDDTAHVARWSGGAELGVLKGQTVRLQLLIQRASLYSFRFAGQ